MSFPNHAQFVIPPGASWPSKQNNAKTTRQTCRMEARYLCSLKMLRDLQRDRRTLPSGRIATQSCRYVLVPRLLTSFVVHAHGSPLKNRFSEERSSEPYWWARPRAPAAQVPIQSNVWPSRQICGPGWFNILFSSPGNSFQPVMLAADASLCRGVCIYLATFHILDWPCGSSLQVLPRVTMLPCICLPQRLSDSRMSVLYTFNRTP